MSIDHHRFQTPTTTSLPDALIVTPDPEPAELVPILEEIPTGTTIPPGVIDPYAEMPSVPADAYVVPVSDTEPLMLSNDVGQLLLQLQGLDTAADQRNTGKQSCRT